jgi:hypothetical protein
MNSRPETMEAPVTIQPGGRRGRFRASHADREHVIETLKVAFVQGRLTKDELDTRVARTLASRTYAELAALTADIPAGLAGLPAEPVPARLPGPPGRRPMGNAAKAGLSIAVALVVMVALTALTGAAGFFLCVCFYFMALLVAGAQVLYSRQQRQDRGKLPPGRRPLDAGQYHTTGQDPGTRPDDTRTDLRRHRPARRLRTLATVPRPG